MAAADGKVNPAQAATPPRYPARMSPTAKPVWLLAGPGRNCAERDQIRIGPLVEPGAADDELAAEIAEMRNRPAEAGQAELEKNAQDFERRASVASSEPDILDR